MTIYLTIWLKLVCLKYLNKKTKCPPCATIKKEFPEILSELASLHALEYRLLAPRLAFMKMYAAPRGGQLKIHGNIVIVPDDVLTTVTALMRLPGDPYIIKVHLKR